MFVGSSFAFIAAVSAAVETKGIEYAQGGIMAAGLVYLIFSLIVYLIGSTELKHFPARCYRSNHRGNRRRPCGYGNQRLP